jgi:tRNA-splicing ligase RtcB
MGCNLIEHKDRRILSWVPLDKLEEECLTQAKNLSELPFMHQHIALMPDAHAGMGMPIGGVLAAVGAIIPNAVGSDIGCGMIFQKTNIPASLLNEVDTPNGILAKHLIGAIMRCVPVGFAHHRDPQNCAVLDRVSTSTHFCQNEVLMPEIKSGYYQFGTLGGGNHFIELQSDDDGNLCIMIHTGSRNFGFKICNYYNKVAQQLNEKWHSKVPKEYRLAFLPLDSDEGQEYLDWMNLALEFARENRYLILQRVMSVVLNSVKKYTGFTHVELENEIECHHNYAVLENHMGANVVVHRKGAIRACKGDRGIIPGSMGSYSYIVEGLGNPRSFHSCSHGAGRLMSRTKAKQEYSVESVMSDLKERGVVLGKHSMSDVAEECVWAYKNIDEVMNNQTDLVKPVLRLRTVAVVKG